MAKKKSNIGQFAPQSNHATVFAKPLHLIGAIVGTTAWFAVLWMAAVGLGFLLHWTEANCPWVPHFMISLGHAVEFLIFGADVVGLVWSVAIHLYRHIKGELKGDGHH